MAPPAHAALRGIRGLPVLVVHPKDRDAEELLAQLRRIGCQASAVWPIPADPPAGVRAMFLSIRPETLDSQHLRRLAQAGPAAVIGVTEYENPATVEALLAVGAVAVTPKPIRAIGLLTTLALALSVYDKADASAKRITKLEGRLTALKEIEQAKSILMSRNRLSEAQAYAALRDRAMARRTTIEEIARAVIAAHDMLEIGPPGGP